jgi:hypothetical protein
MRLTQISRIGGRFALLAGFSVWSLASANSITYFYGYNSPGLTAWQSPDAFGSQNVQFVPQVPMVASSVSAFSQWGAYGNIASAGSFNGVSTSISSIDVAWEHHPSLGATAAAFFNPSPFGSGSESNAYAAPNSMSSGSSAWSNSGLLAPTTTYTGVNASSWNAWQAPTGGGMSDAPQVVAFQPILDRALPAVSSNFGAPSVLPQILQQSAPGSPFALDSGFDAFGTPEPASIGLMAAGLLGLLYLRKRR